MTNSILLIVLMSLSLNVHAYCFKEAGFKMKIDPLLLLAISIRESSLKYTAIGLNKNKNNLVVSSDYGLMQINSNNVDSIFSKYGITKEILLEKPCINVYAGAYILRENFDRWGENWWSVGAYNAGPKKSPEQQIKREIYANEIKSIYLNLIKMDKLGKVNI